MVPCSRWSHSTIRISAGRSGSPLLLHSHAHFSRIATIYARQTARQITARHLPRLGVNSPHTPTNERGNTRSLACAHSLAGGKSPRTPSKIRNNNPHAAVTTLMCVFPLHGERTHVNSVTSALRGRAVAGVMLPRALRALRSLRAQVNITPALTYAGAHAARAPL